MITVGPEQHTLVMAYLRTRGVTEASLQVWDHICKMLASKIEGKGLSPLLPFLEAFHLSRSQPAELSNAQMDDAIISHSLENLSTDSSIPRALEFLLHAPAPVASQDFPSTLLTRLADFLEIQLSALCIDVAYVVPQEKVSAALSLLSLASPEQLYATAAHYPAFISLFQWAELAPQANLLTAEIAQKAREICGKLVKERGTWSLHDLYAMTASRLGELLLEKQCQIRYLLVDNLSGLPIANTSPQSRDSFRNIFQALRVAGSQQSKLNGCISPSRTGAGTSSHLRLSKPAGSTSRSFGPCTG